MKKILILLLCVLILSGCSVSEAAQNNLSATASRSAEAPISPVKSRSERESDIRNYIMELDGIIDATVVISGRTALIGLELENADDEDVRRIKQECAQRAAALDGQIRVTAVTANRHIMDMIEEIGLSRE